MINRILLLVGLLVINGCDDVPGQYRHDNNHHDKLDQRSDELQKSQGSNKTNGRR